MLLSICIPTYNFGKFIQETLDSIIPQLQSNMEIVIVDGGSTDETSEIIKEYQKHFTCIRYHFFSKRGGIDRDLKSCIELSCGQYCWLFSADDIMLPNAISQLLPKLSEKKDVWICGYQICSADVKEVKYKYPISKWKKETEIDLSDPLARIHYFRSAITTSAFFSFLSSIIVRRSKWLAMKEDNTFLGSCWHHVARIFQMMQKGLHLVLLPTDYVKKRSENDSFLDQGIIKRHFLTIHGYHQIADYFFGSESQEAFHIRRVLKNELTLPVLISDLMRIETKEEKKQMLPLLNQLLCDHFFYRLVCQMILLFFLSRFGTFLYSFFNQLRPLFRAYLKYKNSLGFS